MKKRVLRFLGSYELSCALFLILFLLTVLGTFYQVSHGLFEAQQKYFSSMFLIHWIAGIVPLPLPGGYLVLSLMFVNLLIGGVLRAPKGLAKIGILMAHAGMLVLLAGAFLGYTCSMTGYVTLYEGQSATTFQSYHDWEIGVREADSTQPVTEFIIGGHDLQRLVKGTTGTFYASDLPFELTLSDYRKNARVESGVLVTAPASPNAETNLPGLRALVQAQSEPPQEVAVWAAQQPAKVTLNGKQYQIELRRRQSPLPFKITLDKFTRELHPGTNQPKLFRSDVTHVENGQEHKSRISMNEPLRYQGYTLYQSSWGPANARPGQPLYSTLAVVRNPAESLPLWASLVISLGLVVHYGHKLLVHLRSERSKS